MCSYDTITVEFVLLAMQHKCKSYRLSSDDVLFLLLVEAGDALDSHVVCFRGPRREDYIFWVCTDQVGNMLREA